MRRGNKYHGILLDPPHYGRGPKGEKWQFEEHIAPLLDACRQLLAPTKNSFVVISTYAIGYSPLAFENMLRDFDAWHRILKIIYKLPPEMFKSTVQFPQWCDRNRLACLFGSSCQSSAAAMSASISVFSSRRRWKYGLACSLLRYSSTPILFLLVFTVVLSPKPERPMLNTSQCCGRGFCGRTLAPCAASKSRSFVQ